MIIGHKHSQLSYSQIYLNPADKKYKSSDFVIVLAQVKRYMSNWHILRQIALPKVPEIIIASLFVDHFTRDIHHATYMDKEPMSQTVYGLMIQIIWKCTLRLFCHWWCSQLTISHVAQRKSCRHICQTVNCSLNKNYRWQIWTKLGLRAH